MEEQKELNIRINQGDAFFCDSITIADNPTKFVLDFKQNTPRFDPVNLEQNEQRVSMILKHNVVVMDAELAKVLYGMLGERIKKHEEMFGKIKEPKRQKIKEKKGFSSAETIKPSYFG
jgi:hypothetical protein